MLLSLLGKQHCIIESEDGVLGALAEEVKAASGQVFGLRAAVVECRPDTTMEEFWESILVADEEEGKGEERAVCRCLSSILAYNYGLNALL